MKKKGLLLSLLAISFSIGFYVASEMGAKRGSATLSKLAFYEKRVKELEKRLDRKDEGKVIVNRDVTRVIASAYSPRKRETDNDPLVNARMSKARPGTIAVSRDLFWNGWTFGKKVYIEGMGVYTITDLMHKRKRGQIDIFMGSTGDAYQFGRKNIRIALMK